jgi:hypothetical protein
MPVINVRNPRTGEFDYEFTPPTMAELHACARRLCDGQQQSNDGGLLRFLRKNALTSQTGQPLPIDHFDESLLSQKPQNG